MWASLFFHLYYWSCSKRNYIFVLIFQMGQQANKKSGKIII